MSTFSLFIILTYLLSFIVIVNATSNHNRRILHQQPFFPQDNSTTSPSPPPPPDPKYPFTASPSPPSTTTPSPPFFPSYPSPPPPPSLSTFASFPANISSLSLPHSPKHNSTSPKLFILTILALLLALILSFSAAFFYIKKRRSLNNSTAHQQKTTQLGSDTTSHHDHDHNSKVINVNDVRRPTTTSDSGRTSSEFLYLGTLVNNNINNNTSSRGSFTRLVTNDVSSRKWDSPELNPLPPLSKQHSYNNYANVEVNNFRNSSNTSNNVSDSNNYDVDGEEEFYSPRGSLGGVGDRESSIGTRSGSRRDFSAVAIGQQGENFEGKRFSSTNSSSSSSSSASGSPARSVSISISPPVSLSPIRPKSPELAAMDVITRPPPSLSQLSFMTGLEFVSDSDGVSLSSSSSNRSALDSARTSNDAEVNVGLNGFVAQLDCDSKSSSFSSPEREPIDSLRALGDNVRSQPQLPQPSMTQLDCDSKSSSFSSPDREPIHSLRDLDDTVRSQPQLPQPLMTQLDCDSKSTLSVAPERESVDSLKALDNNVRSQPRELQPLMTQLDSDSNPSSFSSPERNHIGSPRISNVSDHNVGSPSGILSPGSKSSNSSSPERNQIESPRISNVSDHNVGSPSRILSHDSKSSISFSPERNQVESPRISNASDNKVRSPSRIFSPNHHQSPIPPPPPPPPPFSAARHWEGHTSSPQPNANNTPISRPPALITPSRPFQVQSPSEVSPFELPTSICKTLEKKEVMLNCETLEKSDDETYCEILEKSEDTPKPKLKTLHWDKVRANSDREMVWDHLRCSSFKLNEEMIETLFVVNNKSPKPKEIAAHPVLPSPKQESNRVLDPKKSQNIAISLRALNVTIEEVHEALLEGNADLLGTELLETLLKMAPTKEEERKLKECTDDSPFKLGPAERFLKAVLDIPFAFKRVDAMLYVANFDSEVEYLKKSFETLEAACEELRNSRMFLKLLEAVLKTGNRMNVGTNRGDAHAFKLDTLLKLVDVKGADGKTTLLHFVVQEIIKAEGARISVANQAPAFALNDDIKCRKLGLQVVSGLSLDLNNVKKAAAMDSDVLSSEVAKLSRGIDHIQEIIRLNETTEFEESSKKFSESMGKFVRTAEEEIIRIQAQESVALSLVKEITEYFHGNSAKEEAHPFRIFMVVRDFLSVLDRVCKEVGTINERTMVSSAHKFPVPVNPTLSTAFPGFHGRQQYNTDYGSSSP